MSLDQVADLPVETSQVEDAELLNVSQRSVRTAKAEQDRGTEARIYVSSLFRLGVALAYRDDIIVQRSW
jgi:hypothetical protein